MLDVGWSEMLVIAVVMIVVVGPKDLPQMLRTFGRMMAKMRGMANDFQKQFNEALKEAELEDVKKSVESLRGLNPAAEIRKQLNPFEQAAADVRAGLDNAMKTKLAETPAPGATEAPPVDPLASGVNVPGGPEAMPTPPTFPPMTDGSATAPVTAPVEKAKPSRKAVKPAPVKATSAKAQPAKIAPAKAATVKAIVSPPVKGGNAVKPAAKPAAAKSAKPIAKQVAAAGKPSAGATAKPTQPAKKSARAPK